MPALESDVLGSAQGVKDITGTSLDDDVINRYLNLAYQQTKDLDLSSCGGDSTLAEIQNFLAAHFLAMSREQQPESESIAGEASVSYRGNSGAGLRATLYGQTAVDLDCSGTLAKRGRKKASIRVFGHEDVSDD